MITFCPLRGSPFDVILFDVMFFSMSGRTCHTFWYHDIPWCHDILFNVMTSLHIPFLFIKYFWCQNILLMSQHTFWRHGIISILGRSGHTFGCYDIPFDMMRHSHIYLHIYAYTHIRIQGKLSNMLAQEWHAYGISFLLLYIPLWWSSRGTNSWMCCQDVCQIEHSVKNSSQNEWVGEQFGSSHSQCWSDTIIISTNSFIDVDTTRFVIYWNFKVNHVIFNCIGWYSYLHTKHHMIRLSS